METLIETIRAATAPDATQETRTSGIEACRTIIGALGGQAVEPLASAPRSEPGPVATAVAALLRTTPPDQLLDMAIAKLRALVPDDGKPAAPMFRWHRVEVQRP